MVPADVKHHVYLLTTKTFWEWMGAYLMHHSPSKQNQLKKERKIDYMNFSRKKVLILIPTYYVITVQHTNAL